MACKKAIASFGMELLRSFIHVSLWPYLWVKSTDISCGQCLPPPPHCQYASRTCRQQDRECMRFK